MVWWLEWSGCLIFPKTLRKHLYWSFRYLQYLVISIISYLIIFKNSSTFQINFNAIVFEKTMQYYRITLLTHCMKSVQIRSFLVRIFLYRIEYGHLLHKLRTQSEYRKIRTRKNSAFGHFMQNYFHSTCSKSTRIKRNINPCAEPYAVQFLFSQNCTCRDNSNFSFTTLDFA